MNRNFATNHTSFFLTIIGSLYLVGYGQKMELSAKSYFSTGCSRIVEGKIILQSTDSNCLSVCQKARLITVKVISGETWGSGILIQKQDNTYTVVTNHHVLLFGEDNSYQIQTPDGKIYQAKQVTNVKFGQKDLSLLQFDSDQNYKVVSISSLVEPIAETEVFAAGFPLQDTTNNESEFLCNQGKIAMIMERPLTGGYEIGYTNDVQRGMSGGPVLNSQGQIIGINGRGPALWGNPFYALEDGTVLSDQKMIEQMEQLSWAIPINILLKLAPDFDNIARNFDFF